MDRGLIAGSLGFLAAFGAERLLASLAKDIARYDAMRRMSGQQPLLKELLSSLGGAIGGTARTNGAAGFVDGLTNDVVRYAKMKGM